jgi:protocatechuate 3,4-dioxygenase beta subunit
MEAINRRRLLTRGAGVAAGALAFSGFARALAGVITPPQTEGPFYPIKDSADKDTDLTLVPGRNARAIGAPIIVRGKVIDTNGKPLSGAVIDVWQACASGRYNHPRDPNTRAALDPNFQYFARLLTDNQGLFQFKTVKPGAYPATNTWMRPPHIHFRVDAWGKKRLTTQMYFKDDPHNVRDDILRDTEQRYGREAAESLVVDFSEIENDMPTGFFTITLGATPEVD